MNFDDTDWSCIFAATRSGSPEGRKALASLCERYRPPAMVWVKVRWRRDTPSAEDVVQGFFEHFLDHKIWKNANEEKGRFRHYFSKCLLNFLRNVYRTIPSNEAVQIPPAEESESEKLHELDLAWARTVMERARAAVHRAWKDRERESDYLTFLRALDGTLSQEEVAAALDMQFPAVRKALDRLREELREAIAREVACTCPPEDVPGEMRYLLTLLLNKNKPSATGHTSRQDA